MAQTNLNIRKIKQRIPFEVKENDPFYSAANMERLRKSAEQMEKSVNTKQNKDK